jgi:hypothetical protein
MQKLVQWRQAEALANAGERIEFSLAISKKDLSCMTQKLGRGATQRKFLLEVSGNGPGKLERDKISPTSR